jgi:26S proteasome regulatory subunit N7
MSGGSKDASAAAPAARAPLKKQSSVGNISEEMEDDLSTLPNMAVSELYFLLQHHHARGDKSTLNVAASAAHREELMALVREHKMAPFYRRVCSEFQWPVDAALASNMEAANAEELRVLDERLVDAEQNLGDIEVLEALLAKARMHSRVGDKQAALDAFKAAGEKPQSGNQRILVALHVIRIGLFFRDLPLVETHIKRAAVLIDEGGDWDRRNRLKVYEGCYLMMARDLKRAARLFQESVATFTATELMPYDKMIFYCVLTCVLHLGRVDLKKKIVDSPEILAVINDIPHLADFLHGLYDCDYKKFFTAMVALEPYILRDKYLSTHARFLYRELRVLAYAQFLEAYRSVTLASMSRAFGVSVAFLDAEVARFVAAGRLNAKIDKVAGVIETNRPDAKNAQYQDAIKKGDLLLNNIQKLARVINV